MNFPIKRIRIKQREDERRDREDSSPRLSSLIPTLKTLALDIVDRSGSTSVRYKKHVVVASAPALFVIPCGEPRCEDGGHDLTHIVLTALRAQRTVLEGDSTCRGSAGSAPCGREMHYSLVAEYRSA